MDKKHNILSLFNEDADISCRSFSISKVKIDAYYINCLVDGKLVASGVFDSINKLARTGRDLNSSQIFNLLKEQMISASDLTIIKSPSEIQENIFNGGVVIKVGGKEELISVNVAGFIKDGETEGIISRADSTVPVYVIPTNEELMIALDTYELIS